MKTFRALASLALVLVMAAPTTGLAQAGITGADIQRLQDELYDVSRDVARMRDREPSLASRLQADLDDAKDETIYLKVKLRKRETVTRADYADLRDQIDAIRRRAHGDEPRALPPAAPPAREVPPPPPPAPPAAPMAPEAPATARATLSPAGELPVGTEFDVRVQSALSSATAQVEDRFEATTEGTLEQGARVVVPAGSLLRGVVSSVNKAGRIERRGSLTLVFDQVTVNGKAYPIRATVEQTIQSEGIRGEGSRLGTGASVGAIIGGMLGGVKGALAGVLIGAGGTMAATEGKDVELPPGTLLRVRLDTALSVK